MGCLLSSGWAEPCKDTLGGVKEVYLAPYVYYSPDQYVIDDKNTLIQFPSTRIFSVSTKPAQNISTESWQGQAYSQSLTLALPKLDLHWSRQVEAMLSQDLRIIILTNDGIYKILGLVNGLSLENTGLTTGSARTDFNGYTLEFAGRELDQAAFIDDLTDSGFYSAIPYDFQDTTEYQFQDGTEYDFQTSIIL